jgi:hypothetical protein
LTIAYSGAQSNSHAYAVTVERIVANIEGVNAMTNAKGVNKYTADSDRVLNIGKNRAFIIESASAWFLRSSLN